VTPACCSSCWSQIDSERAFRLAESNQLIVPEFVLLEIGNALWRRVRSGAGEARAALRLLDELKRFDLDIRSVQEFVAPALSRAMTLGHPIYDCLYLAMAEMLDLTLVTADQRFLSALRGASAGSVRVNALADFV
jgi:predicted nucleic acid-binding protein